MPEGNENKLEEQTSGGMNKKSGTGQKKNGEVGKAIKKEKEACNRSKGRWG